MDRLTRAHDAPLPAERGLNLTFNNEKGFPEIVAMRRRAAAGWNMHVNQAKPAGGFLAAQNDRVGVADDAEVREVVPGVFQCKAAGRVVVGNRP